MKACRRLFLVFGLGKNWQKRKQTGIVTVKETDVIDCNELATITFPVDGQAVPPGLFRCVADPHPPLASAHSIDVSILHLCQ